MSTSLLRRRGPPFDPAIEARSTREPGSKLRTLVPNLSEEKLQVLIAVLRSYRISADMHPDALATAVGMAYRELVAKLPELTRAQISELLFLPADELR